MKVGEDVMKIRQVDDKRSNFLRFFLKALELLECRRGDLYMTANRNY